MNTQGEIRIVEATDRDRQASLDVECDAFGNDSCADLVELLLDDPTARPALSLLAWRDDQPVGHVLFTRAVVEPEGQPLSVSLLAPLAVVPEKQNRGIGGMLVREGLKRLSKHGVDLVFVLGHPDYYPRFGFQPAGCLGCQAPYPIPPENAGAWMMQELREGVIGSVSGTVKCAEAIDKPEYWRE